MNYLHRIQCKKGALYSTYTCSAEDVEVLHTASLAEGKIVKNKIGEQSLKLALCYIITISKT